MYFTLQSSSNMPLSPTEIKQRLKARGLSMSAIARRVRPQVKPQHVREVIHGRQSARIQNAVARALGLTVAEVFGGESIRQAA